MANIPLDGAEVEEGAPLGSAESIADTANFDWVTDAGCKDLSVDVK